MRTFCGVSDAAAARRDYLDETGGRYVHVIANGRIETSGAQTPRVHACWPSAEPLQPECVAQAARRVNRDYRGVEVARAGGEPERRCDRGFAHATRTEHDQGRALFQQFLQSIRGQDGMLYADQQAQR